MTLTAADTETTIDSKSTVETIQDELLRRICFLDYAPGAQLKEADLAREFGVSRTPVRDAIARISHLGLVETRNGVGTVVVSLSDQDIRQVYDMRLELAPLIGRLSPQPVDASHVATCRALLAEARDSRHAFDPGRYIVLNHRLHSLIASLIGNKALRACWWQTYYQAASTWYRVGRSVGVEAAESLIAELQEVAVALETGDVAAIGHIQRIHIGYGFARIERHILDRP